MSFTYNTTLGLPYIRISELKINYGTTDSELIRIEGFEKQAVALSDNSIMLGEGFSGSICKTFSKDDLLNGNFDLINITTGEKIGKTMSNMELFIALTSFIRKIQLESR